MEMNIEQALMWLEINSLEGLDSLLLKKIYRKLALKHHPDKGGKAQDFINLKKAYLLALEILKNNSNQKSSFDNSNSSNNSNYNSDNSNNELKTKYSELFQEYEFFKNQNLDLADQNQKYSKIINDQVTIIQQFQFDFDKINQEYQSSSNNLENWYKTNEKQLTQKYVGKWWQAILGQSMSREQFELSKNNLIEAYNKTYLESKQKYNNDILDCYESIINKIISILN